MEKIFNIAFASITFLILSSHLHAYKVDGVRSGISMERLRSISSRRGYDPNNGGVYLAALMSHQSSNSVFYKKLIFGEKASIIHEFTPRGKRLYKTTISWDTLSGAFTITGGFTDKKRLKIFLEKLKSFLEKKYGPPKVDGKTLVYQIDNNSEVRLESRPASVKLTYFDRKVGKNLIKEKKILERYREKKEFQDAMQTL